MPQEMKVLIGLPGSGKTTFATEVIASVPGWSRINYDNLRWFDRVTLKPREYTYSRDAERAIKAEAEQFARAYFQLGENLVIDNTNLTHGARMRWAHLAGELGMNLSYQGFDTPIHECIRRDNLRTGWQRVGRAVIERMALFSETTAVTVHYPLDKQLVLVDMDGTLADCTHRRHHLDTTVLCQSCHGFRTPSFSSTTPCLTCNGAGTFKQKKDYANFYEGCDRDSVIRPVAEWVRSLEGLYNVCIVSGRPTDLCGDKTVAWLERNNVPFNRIFMRNGGDFRPDFIVKKEILDHLPKDRIAFAIDDRQQVVDMWRENGIKVYQVAEGNF